jgi:dTDP-4-dehydrorhamnose reductase
LHHGNGPTDTDLLDPAFPERFAAFARAVADRYPWVDAYVPINEPLTTARFCGLYGFWHPHEKTDAAFARILHHQVLGSILAMQAIREIAPAATYIQNEDIGKVHATPTLAYEADLQNERRWLTFDLLCGRVDRDHVMWPVLSEGMTDEELERYLEEPFPPDVVGFDHYVSSERFLDDALDPYPDRYHSRNARHEYADVEAVWSLSDGPVGVEPLLQEAWDRYRMPLALTEVHLGGTREEQIRWLVESYEAALAVRSRGGDVRAVTAWALLGMYDWNSLMLDPSGFYESGAFDVRGGTPRETALADTIRALARGGSYAHPVLSVPGWWRRPERLIYRREPVEPPAAAPGDEVRRAAGLRSERADLHAVGSSRTPQGRSTTTRLALVTNGGALADAFRTACTSRGLAFEEVEVGPDAAPEDVAGAIAEIRPWCVLDVIGIGAAIGDVFEEAALSRPLRPETVDRVVATHRAVAREAARLGVVLLVASSWTVFDGGHDRPRVETEPPDARSDLGRAWRRAEAGVLAEAPNALVARPGPLLGSPLVTLDAVDDPSHAGSVVVAPAFGPDVASVALDLLIDGEGGIWHLANAGLVAIPVSARLRGSSVLGTARAVLLPTLRDAVGRARDEAPAHDDLAAAAADDGDAAEDVPA